MTCPPTEAGFTPATIANYFLYSALETGTPNPRSLTHLKVQKLVFFVYAWGLALYERNFLSERPEAWEHGPIFSSLYHRLKTLGSKPMKEYELEMSAYIGQLAICTPSSENRPLSDLLEQVKEQYGNLNALQLSDLSNQDDSPWAQARSLHQGWLDDAVVTEYYRELLRS